jgi:Flp pilus assembly protein TadG
MMPSPFIPGLIHRLRRDKRGNVMVMTAVALTTLCFAFGFVVDFSRAEAAQTELNAIADAAALAAVDPSMIYQSNATAQTAATQMWNSQVAQINGLTGITMTPSVSTGSGIGGLRNAKITWTANSTNIFANFLGLTSLALSGTSSAAASQPPNINFYVMVDNSPSMLIPDSTAGISELQQTTTTGDGGCAFTCHNRLPQTSYSYEVTDLWPTSSTKGYIAWVPDSPYTSPSMTGSQYFMWVKPTDYTKVYDPGKNLLANYQVCAGSDGTTVTSVSMATTNKGCSGTTISGQWADGYWAVENFSVLYPGNSNIELRIDDASNAVKAIGPYAYNLSTTNNATYAMQGFFYNSKVSDPQNLYPSFPSGASQISGTAVVQMTPMTTMTSATSFNPPTIPVTRWVDSVCMTANSCPNQSPNGDTTDNPSMLTEMNTLIPTPGTGQLGSTPQAVLFLITDGYDDMYGTNRGPFTTAELAQCSAIKARGIKIAIIYTQYLAGSISATYPSYAAVLTPTDQVAAALQSCASTNASGSPLYYQVSQNESIVPALQQLFASVVQSAYLLN